MKQLFCIVWTENRSGSSITPIFLLLVYKELNQREETDLNRKRNIWLMLDVDRFRREKEGFSQRKKEKKPNRIFSHRQGPFLFNPFGSIYTRTRKSFDIHGVLHESQSDSLRPSVLKLFARIWGLWERLTKKKKKKYPNKSSILYSLDPSSPLCHILCHDRTAWIFHGRTSHEERKVAIDPSIRIRTVIGSVQLSFFSSRGSLCIYLIEKERECGSDLEFWGWKGVIE